MFHAWGVLLYFRGDDSLSLSLLVLVTLFFWVESEYWMLSYFFVFVFVAILAKMHRRACVFLGRRKVAN
jgi:hypothetical protein